MGQTELIFYYGYDLSSLTTQQCNVILNAYEKNLIRSTHSTQSPSQPSPSTAIENNDGKFDEDSAIGIRRPGGVHCPLVELLAPYVNDDDDEDNRIKELRLQKKLVGNQFNPSFDLAKLNEIEKEILKIREEKVRNLIMTNYVNIEGNRGKRKLELDEDGENNDRIVKKRKIEKYSASTTPTTPVSRFSLEFILNSPTHPPSPSQVEEKAIQGHSSLSEVETEDSSLLLQQPTQSSQPAQPPPSPQPAQSPQLPPSPQPSQSQSQRKDNKNYYIAPLGLYRDYSGVNVRSPYFYFFRFSHFNQSYALDSDLMRQIETLAKTKEDEINRFFNELGIVNNVNLQQPRWIVSMHYS